MRDLLRTVLRAISAAWAKRQHDTKNEVNVLALYSLLKRPVELITARQQPSPRPENTREQASCLKSSVTLVSDDASQGAKIGPF